MAELLSDRPIGSPENDRFGRGNFAKAIASALVLPAASPSIVVAIEGEWGSGKTSVLNMVEECLSQHQGEPLVIRLEAWLLGGADSALSTFLTQLAARVGSKDKGKKTAEVAGKILMLANVMAPLKFIPVVGPVVQGAVKAVGEGAKSYADFVKMDIQKKKLDVAKAIESLSRPIIVIVDDLDRLEPEEVRDIFRLVKAVADFERVAYLLSYDPVPVHQALSYEGVYDGVAYLEKIVQVAYPLPRLGYWALKRYLESRLEDFMAEFHLKELETQRLSELLSSGGLVHALRHPRDVNRLINRLRVSVPATLGEVNASDVVGFEALGILYPDVAATIRRRPYDFVGDRQMHEEVLVADYIAGFRSQEQKGSKELPQWKRDLWKDLSEERMKPLVSLLEFLFPGFPGSPYVARHLPAQQQEGALLICRSTPLLKLLSVGPTDGTFSARDVEKFFGQPEVRRAMLDDLFTGEVDLRWFYYASQFVEAVKMHDVRHAVSVMLDKAGEISESTDKEVGEAIEAMASFATELVGCLSGEEQKGFLLWLASDSKSLTFTCRVVISIARQHGLADQDYSTQKKIVNSEESARAVVQGWLSAVRVVAKNSLKLIKEPQSLLIISYWMAFSDGVEAREWIDNLTSSDEGLSRFMTLWSPYNNLAGLDSFLSDWRRFKDRCEQHLQKESLREDLWAYFDALEKREREAIGNG